LKEPGSPNITTCTSCVASVDCYQIRKSTNVPAQRDTVIAQDSRPQSCKRSALVAEAGQLGDIASRCVSRQVRLWKLDSAPYLSLIALRSYFVLVSLASASGLVLLMPPWQDPRFFSSASVLLRVTDDPAIPNSFLRDVSAEPFCCGVMACFSAVAGTIPPADSGT
jgi:hypothetical protein